MIRPERSVEHYSRGAELYRAIQKLWVENAKDRFPIRVAQRIDDLLAEFDLTLEEWYYWATHIHGQGKLYVDEDEVLG